MNKLLLRLLITAFALYAAVQLVPGIAYEGSWQGLLAMALIFGLVNAIVRPLLSLLTCPLIILTMGLFLLVINALMLLLATRLAEIFRVSFYVSGFGAAFWGALVVSVVSLIGNLMIIERDDEDS